MKSLLHSMFAALIFLAHVSPTECQWSKADTGCVAGASIFGVAGLVGYVYALNAWYKASRAHSLLRNDKNVASMALGTLNHSKYEDFVESIDTYSNSQVAVGEARLPVVAGSVALQDSLSGVGSSKEGDHIKKIADDSDHEEAPVVKPLATVFDEGNYLVMNYMMRKSDDWKKLLPENKNALDLHVMKRCRLFGAKPEEIYNEATDSAPTRLDSLYAYVMCNIFKQKLSSNQCVIGNTLKGIMDYNNQKAKAEYAKAKRGFLCGSLALGGAVALPTIGGCIKALVEKGN